ncbi:RNA polymerase sigma factor [Spirosoma luteum]|uniref:RNA polymerase sigma factor n=1 Tax=Spirosoma luteum TaxID=431553 RepID=UPI0003A21340|nr:sigma-70 family RNA polymerase sigma factor [Spirosoma luteum]
MRLSTKYTSLTDEEVIQQILPTQPNQCFESLYSRYVSKVYQRCLSMTHDSEKAHDFTHDIFLKVFDKLPTFQQRSSFSTWLYSISYNYCSDQLRIAKRLPLMSIDQTVNLEIADSQEAQIQEETRQLVSRAMTALSVQEQTLLSLKYEQGMSIEKIADLYAIKASAVKMRLKRSRGKLQGLYNRSLVL